MSHNPYVRDSAAQAHEKVARKQASATKTEFVARWKKMTANMEARLASAGITIDEEPEPDMSGIPVVDYGRRVQVPTNRQAYIPALLLINDIYAAEADLISSSVRAVQEHDLLLRQDSKNAESPGLFASAQDQAITIQGIVDATRA
jgi:hypothetical protein